MPIVWDLILHGRRDSMIVSSGMMWNCGLYQIIYEGMLNGGKVVRIERDVVNLAGAQVEFRGAKGIH